MDVQREQDWGDEGRRNWGESRQHGTTLTTVEEEEGEEVREEEEVQEERTEEEREDEEEVDDEEEGCHDYPKTTVIITGSNL